MISNELFICDLDCVLKLNENVEMREGHLSLVTHKDDSLEKMMWPMPVDGLGSSPDPTSDAP